MDWIIEFFGYCAILVVLIIVDAIHQDKVRRKKLVETRWPSPKKNGE